MKLNVTIAGVELKNPIMTASGTFGSVIHHHALLRPMVA